MVAFAERLAKDKKATLPSGYAKDFDICRRFLDRLVRQGVDVGARWEELADKAETRFGDCLNPFTLPHWMMALTGAGRWNKAQTMLEAMRAVAGRNSGTIPPLVRNYALPVCEAVLANAQGAGAGRRADGAGDRRHVPAGR